MKLETLHDVYLDNLKDLYSAEKQLVAALPKMAKAASTDELREAFSAHLVETKGHVDRLDQIFKDMDKNPKGKKCKGMEGLLEEGKEILEEEAEPSSARDAALISAAQRVEHYEIAAYGCARTFAKVLGEKEAETLLQETLDEEAAADEKLTQLAEGVINEEAAVGKNGNE